MRLGVLFVEDSPGDVRLTQEAFRDSADEMDISKSYQLQANCYLNKPVELDEFETIVKTISDFWQTRAKLPPQANTG